MSGDDLLASATSALRETTAPGVAEDKGAAATLARIERSTRSAQATRQRRRTYTRWVAVPMAASFLVFVAWASASGHLTRWLTHPGHEEAEYRGLVPTTSTSEAARPAVLAPIVSAAPTPDPSANEVSSSAPPPPAKKAPPPPPASVDVDSLYREAHDIHFVRRDPAAALVAWDRYLAAAGPSGRFALEARYNRAISLVRLGRRDEAAAALRPFANGEYGGYRRDEAAQLLRTLE